MRRLRFIKILVIILLVFLAGGIYAALPKTAQGDTWQPASSIAPPELMAQVIQENINPEIQVNAAQMRVWKIQLPGQSTPLYLIDSRIANSAGSPQNNPLCGALGCAFWGYVQEENYRRVFASYLDPRLPPDIPLIEPTNIIQNGLPNLKINQLQNHQIQQLTLSFNGQFYEAVETQLLPQRYE